MTGQPTYPWVPKSTAHPEAGQFSAFPLSDGRFACDRVLTVWAAVSSRWAAKDPDGCPSGSLVER